MHEHIICYMASSSHCFCRCISHSSHHTATVAKEGHSNPPHWQNVPTQQPSPPPHNHQNHDSYSAYNGSHTQNGNQGPGGYPTYPNHNPSSYAPSQATQATEHQVGPRAHQSLIGSRHSGWSTGLFDCCMYCSGTCETLLALVAFSPCWDH